MPELTIVESWRVMTVRSAALIPFFMKPMLISLELCFSEMSRTMNEFALS